MEQGKIVIAGVLWGFVGVFALSLKGTGLTTGEVAELRFIFSALALGAFLFFYDKKLLKPKNIFSSFMLGTFNFITTLCYYKCIGYSGASVACVLLYSSPVVVVCVVAAINKKPPSKITVLAIIATLLGLMLAGNVFSARASKQGFIFGVVSALSNAAVTLVGARGIKKSNPLTLNFYGFLFSAILGIMFLRTESLAIALKPYNLLTVLALAVLCTVIPYTLYVSALKGCSAEKASLLCSSEPIVASVLDCVIYSRSPTFGLIMGLGSIVIAVWLVGIKNSSITKVKEHKKIKTEKVKKEGKYVDKQILQGSSDRAW